MYLKNLFCYHRYTIPKSTLQQKTKIFHVTFVVVMSLWKFVSHVTKEGNRKQSHCLRITFFSNGKHLQTIYHIYCITNFMENILADKILYSDISFWKKTKKIIVNNVTVSKVTFCPSKKDTIAAWKNTTSWILIQYDCVTISHAFALHLSSNSFKTMFLSRCKLALKLCIFSSF